MANKAIDHINKLYPEITSHCNLDCAMCTRKNWKNEGIGHMSKKSTIQIHKNLLSYTQ